MVSRQSSSRLFAILFMIIVCSFIYAESISLTPFSTMMRTFNRQNTKCRSGLCPHIKRLYPEDYLRHGPKDVRGGKSYEEESYEDDGSHDSLCGNMCTQDSDCSGTRKCCPTTCGYACYEAVYITN